MLIFFIAHIALHWNWMVLTTKKFFTRGDKTKAGEIIEANYIFMD